MAEIGTREEWDSQTPQGLKPASAERHMSELKRRPPKRSEALDGANESSGRP
jgi:hypothetical protein